MPKRDSRIDAYIAKAQPFAQSILKHLRAVVHAACPACTETIKWGMPAFDYKGPLAGMAAFKQHAAFNFWKHKQLLGPRPGGAMGSFGRITSVKDLPGKGALVALIKRAKQLNDEGTPSPMAGRKQRAALPTPAFLRAALARNARARKQFDAFPPGKRRDYIEWLTEAKSEETRQRRLDTALTWIAQGKGRNWKYEQKAR